MKGRDANRVFQLSFERCTYEAFKVIKLTDNEPTIMRPNVHVMASSVKTHEWKLGLGPCGRTVLGLKVRQDRSNGYLTIYQWCDDNPGNPDEFVYPLNRFKALRFYRTETPEVAPTP